MGERAVIRLGGIVGMRKGPTTRGGMIVMKSMPCSLANFQASFSASVLETKYIYTSRKKNARCSLICSSFVFKYENLNGTRC